MSGRLNKLRSDATHLPMRRLKEVGLFLASVQKLNVGDRLTKNEGTCVYHGRQLAEKSCLVPTHLGASGCGDLQNPPKAKHRCLHIKRGAEHDSTCRSPGAIRVRTVECLSHVRAEEIESPIVLPVFDFVQAYNRDIVVNCSPTVCFGTKPAEGI